MVNNKHNLFEIGYPCRQYLHNRLWNKRLDTAARQSLTFKRINSNLSQKLWYKRWENFWRKHKVETRLRSWHKRFYATWYHYRSMALAGLEANCLIINRYKICTANHRHLRKTRQCIITGARETTVILLPFLCMQQFPLANASTRFPWTLASFAISQSFSATRLCTTMKHVCDGFDYGQIQSNEVRLKLILSNWRTIVIRQQWNSVTWNTLYVA